MSAAPALPACPRCPDRTLQPFSADGLRLICTGCSRTYRAGNLEEDASVDDLVRQCLAEDRRRGQHGGGGSRSKSRTTPKAGELEWRRQQRQERRYFDQPTGAIGKPERDDATPCTEHLSFKTTEDQAERIAARAQAAKMSQSEYIRLCIDLAEARQWCHVCQMPRDPGKTCEGCGC